MSESVKEQMEEIGKYIDDKIKNANLNYQPFLRHNHEWIIECYQKCGDLYRKAGEERPTWSQEDAGKAVAWLIEQMTKLSIYIDKNKTSVGCVQDKVKPFPDPL